MDSDKTFFSLQMCPFVDATTLGRNSMSERKPWETRSCCYISGRNDVRNMFLEKKDSHVTYLCM